MTRTPDAARRSAAAEIARRGSDDPRGSLGRPLPCPHREVEREAARARRAERRAEALAEEGS